MMKRSLLLLILTFLIPFTSKAEREHDLTIELLDVEMEPLVGVTIEVKSDDYRTLIEFGERNKEVLALPEGVYEVSVMEGDFELLEELSFTLDEDKVIYPKLVKKEVTEEVEEEKEVLIEEEAEKGYTKTGTNIFEIVLLLMIPITIVMYFIFKRDINKKRD